MRIRDGKKNSSTAAYIILAAITALSTPCLSAAAPVAAFPPSTAIAHQIVPVTTDGLDTMIRKKDYIDLSGALPRLEHVTAAERDYFQGILENHSNAVVSSARHLEHAIPALRRSGASERLRTALKALADDYGKRFDYGRAAETYRTLGGDDGVALSESDRHEIRDDADLYDVLRGQPVQTVTFGTSGRSSIIQGHRDPLGLLEAPVSVGDTPTGGVGAAPGRAETWVVDTGANISTVTRSTAIRLGLKLLSGKATVQGMGGAEVSMQVAVIPVLRLGGATVRYAAVLVLDDKALNVGQPAYQIQGIIGFPVLAALGRLTFGPTDRISIGASVRTPGPINLYLEGLTPLVAADPGDGVRLFTFDSGANISVLTARYWREHQSELTAATAMTYRFMGADGLKSVPARKADSVTLQIGGVTVPMTQLPVLTEPIGNPTTDAFYGNLGQNLVLPFTSFTLDFGSMHFSLQK